MKIGIYGGAFNPPHLGHTNILKGFYDSINLDKLIVIPTNVSPHKLGDMSVSNSDRIKMCKLAIKDENINALVSNIEMKRDGKSYTVDTLKELKQIYQNDEIYFLMGEDMFLSLEKWYKTSKILEICTICAVKRSENGTKTLENHAKKLKEIFENFSYIILDIPYIEVSSTDIRNGNFKNLSKSVADYIIKQKLYL